jgi:hypothetical protein
MDIKEIRKLVREGHSVVLVEEGQAPLLVTEIRPSSEEVPIASRQPVRSGRPSGDQILERLNKEILALKAQVDQEGN